MCLIIFSPFAFASKEKDEVKKILPYKYERVRKIKADKKIAYAGENTAFISLYSPDGLYDNFMRTYYSQNNKLQNMKFENYPDNGVIRYKQGDKYGIIYVNGNIIHIAKPVFKKVEFPDENSLVSKILNVSFAPLDKIILYVEYPLNKTKGEYIYKSAQALFNENPFAFKKGYVYMPSAFIDENIEVKNNNLYVTYKNITVDCNDYTFSPRKNTPSMMPDISNIGELYNFINNNTGFELKGYPLKGILKTGQKLYFFDEDKMQRIKGLYDDYQLNGTNIFINKLTGLNLSFQSPDKIIAKKTEKWGMIDQEGNVKIPFIYDEIFTQNINVNEKISENEKLVMKYISQSAENNIFIARKGKKYGVINENNEILVPFEYIKYSENNELDNMKTQVGITMKKDISRENRRETMHALPWILTSYLLFPLWLIMPYPNLNVNIKY